MNKANRTLAALAVLAALGLMAPAATRAQQLVTADPPEQVLAIAQNYGEARMDTDSQGNPMIIGTISGIHYFGFFYGCDGKGGAGCDSLQLRASWTVGTVSLQHINEWNRTRRFGKAYLEDDGDVALEMEVNLDFGVTYDNLNDTFDWWRIGITEFADHLRDR
jgi:hypothetical protein